METFQSPLKTFLNLKGRVVECSPKGVKNKGLASLVLNKGSVLLTRDYGFANTILYPKQLHGIIVLHIHPQKPKN